MASFKSLGLLAISCAAFSLNATSINAQVNISNSKSSGLSPAQQMLVDMRQTNAPAVGAGSMQLFRVTDKNVSFVPLEGIDRLFNWQPSTDKGVSADKTMGDRVEQFKSDQRQQVASGSEMFQVMNRINSNK
ncbi:MAG: hypothetical protein DCF20_17835 [Pseudanabaena sp.]|nr:MAG: hypothetical protein DCF20_17835 [Pseudanabaena sp.]